MSHTKKHRARAKRSPFWADGRPIPDLPNPGCRRSKRATAGLGDVGVAHEPGCAHSGLLGILEDLHRSSKSAMKALRMAEADPAAAPIAKEAAREALRAAKLAGAGASPREVHEAATATDRAVLKLVKLLARG